uniref:Uncharacterized protein n=1 Tax=Trypanosoma vivax (strain Y486) TaxID=1055687 RepID=G0TSE2_TRYVY|nr:hypothetical protein TVY486_0300620 [Trypanosoma vivax Y486]
MKLRRSSAHDVPLPSLLLAHPLPPSLFLCACLLVKRGVNKIKPNRIETKHAEHMPDVPFLLRNALFYSFSFSNFCPRGYRCCGVLLLVREGVRKSMPIYFPVK